MADPLTILSVIEGSLSLIIQCSSVAKTLNDIAGKFKQLRLTILSMTQELETIEFAWTRIKVWSQQYVEDAADLEDSESLDRSFLDRLRRSLECGRIVMGALQDDLDEFVGTGGTLSFTQRARVAWNAKTSKDHQDRIRGQTAAMNLLLQVLDLPTPKARTSLVEAQRRQFSESDESAYSIIPSQMSLKQSSHFSWPSRNSSVASVDLVYRRLSFEDDLFTGAVYKRNFKKLLVDTLHRTKCGGNAGQNLGNDMGVRGSPGTLQKQSSPQAEGAVARGTDPLYSHPETLPPKSLVLYSTSQLSRALLNAVGIGRLDHVEALLKYRAPIDCRMSHTELTPLHIAAAQGQIAMTKLLLKFGADVHSKTSNFLEPVDLALAGAFDKVVQILINAGADFQHIVINHKMPLHSLASQFGQSKLIESYVANGADVDVRDEANRTALDVA